MKLVDLAPRWISYQGRSGVGVSFECPCCTNTDRCIRLAVFFINPLDGGQKVDLDKNFWQRSGDTFENLTLSPSIDASSPDSNGRRDWHGHITNGEIQ